MKHLAGEHRALKVEDAYPAIVRGGTCKWENWHQTGRATVGLPGSPITPDPPYVGGHAGCSECVHAHWSWFSGAPDQIRRGWSDGRPQLLDGSQQTACIGWAAAVREDTQVDWCARATASPDWRGRPLSGHDRPVMYWQTQFRSDTAPTAAPGNDRCTGADKKIERNQARTVHSSGKSDCTGIILDNKSYPIGTAPGRYCRTRRTAVMGRCFSFRRAG